MVSRWLTPCYHTNRTVQELMDTYYPLDDLSNKDYARKAARRVGLEIRDQ